MMIYSVYARDSVADELKIRDKVTDGFNFKQTVVAFHGACVVREEQSDFFGGEESSAYQSKVMVNPTFRKLYGIAKEQQKATKDYHHIFFEGVLDTGEDVVVRGQTVRLLRLMLGS